jgi:hypothetical protein
MKRNLTHGVSGIPNRESFEQFAAARFRLLPRQQSLAYDLEFHDAERSFDAQYQLIVEIIQIVDLLLVSDKRSKDLADLQQPTPVFVRAGEPRYFPAAEDSDLSQCHQAEDTLEALALSGGKARARSQVTIDDFDLPPAQRAHPFGHRILEELTLPYSVVLVFRWIAEGRQSPCEPGAPVSSWDCTGPLSLTLPPSS